MPARKNTNPLSVSNTMTQAIQAATKAGVHPEQKTAFQLKVGPFSFYPDTGTIYRDGDGGARPEKGIAAFLRILREEGLADSDAKPVRPADDRGTIELDIHDDDERWPK